MDMRRIGLEIITPRGVKFERQARSLVFRCIDGNMGILPGHEPTSVIMGDGILRIIGEEGTPEEQIAVFGGVATVENDHVKLLTSIAQLPEEIDLERAERDKEELVQLLQERESAVEIPSSLVQLRRALVRIEIITNLQGDDD